MKKFNLKSKPPFTSMSEEQKAIWHIKKNEFDLAHQIVQDMDSPLACEIHGLVHEVEGDQWNAHYWYSRAHSSKFESPETRVESLVERAFGSL